eukprot:GHVR01045727.1.p1 GENE.GHVR01045727.1~~GHVR01045727.1.p1  ORF type:complete len:615 (-),score=58.73 GHVR01045727.1:1173-3017(-)
MSFLLLRKFPLRAVKVANLERTQEGWIPKIFIQFRQKPFTVGGAVGAVDVVVGGEIDDVGDTDAERLVINTETTHTTTPQSTSNINEMAYSAIKDQHRKHITAKGHVAATKEEVRNGDFDQTMTKELIQFQKYKVIEKENNPQNITQIIPCVWLHTHKIVNKPGKEPTRKAKSRLVVLGNKDSQITETYSGTPDLGHLKMVLIYTLSRNWDTTITDVVTAFLQAGLDNDIKRHIRLPSHLPPDIKKYCPSYSAGAVYKLTGNIYGLDFAPRVYTRWFKGVVGKLGWIEIAESIFSKTADGIIEAVLIMYVDDLLIFSNDNHKHIHTLQKYVAMEDGEDLSDGFKHSYLGMEIQKLNQHTINMNMNKYLSTIHTNNTSKKTLCEKNIRNKFHIPAKITDNIAVKEYQQLLGQMMWISKCRPDLAYSLGELARRSTKATKEDLVILGKLAEFAKGTERNIVFKRVTKGKLIGISDASYDIREYDGRIGFEIRLTDEHAQAHELSENENLLTWGSKMLKLKVGSTTSAELHAHMKVVKLMPKYIELFKKLTGKNPKVEYIVDSRPLINQLQTGKAFSEPALQGVLDYVIQERARQGASVHWIESRKITADKYTKFKL